MTSSLRLTLLPPNREMAVRVRAKGNGAIGPWSERLHFRTPGDEVAPNPPSNVQLSYADGTAVLTWDPPTHNEDGSVCDDLRDYHITIFETNTPFPVDNPNTSTREDLVWDTAFYVHEPPFSFPRALNAYLFGGTPKSDLTFWLRSADTNGNVSRGHAEVTMSAQRPAPFDMLTAVSVNLAVRLTWQTSEDDDLDHYKIYRQVGSRDVRDNNAGATPVFVDDILVGRTVGTETNFEVSSPGPGAKTYYVVAHDAMGLVRPSRNALSAAPEGYWQGDPTAPSYPLSFNAVSRVATNDNTGSTAEILATWTAPTTNADGSPLDDHSGFLLRWSRNVNGPWQSVEIADNRNDPSVSSGFEYLITNAQAGTRYFLRLQTFDRYGNYSSHISTTADPVADTIPPSQPVAPTAAASTLRIQVRHPLNRVGGGKLEEDVNVLEVYIGPSSTFSPVRTGAGTNYIGNVTVMSPKTGFVATGSFPLPDTETTTDPLTQRKIPVNRWVRVVAIDHGGNRSDPSAAADAGIIPLIEESFIQTASITDASIVNLSATKLTAGEGVITNLNILSRLTIDNQAGRAGEIRSSDYESKSKGYILTDKFLEINEGRISAAALNLNSSPNVMPWEYADWENPGMWYTGGTDSAGLNVPRHLTIGAGATGTALSTEWKATGEASLAIVTSASSSNTSPAVVHFGTTTAISAVNIFDLHSAKRYILSAFMRTFNNKTINGNFAIRFASRNPDGSTSWSGVTRRQPFSIHGNQGERRNWGVFTVPSASNAALIFIEVTTPSARVFMDAFQLERVQDTLANVNDSDLTPGAYKSPTFTKIDGGMIETGEIRSTNYSSTTGWRIGMEGNATFRNAFLRGGIEATSGTLQNLTVTGKITVGGSGTNNHRLESYDGSWSLGGNGLFKAENADIAGKVTATGGSITGNLEAYQMVVGVEGTSLGFIRSGDFGDSANVNIKTNRARDPNYTGAVGWVLRSGPGSSGYSAVFNNAWIRGHLNASDITAGTLDIGDIGLKGTIKGVLGGNAVALQLGINTTYPQGRFQVTTAGALDATAATIRGTNTVIIPSVNTNFFSLQAVLPNGVISPRARMRLSETWNHLVFTTFGASSPHSNNMNTSPSADYGVTLKLLNSPAQAVQSRNGVDTAYADFHCFNLMVTGNINEVSDRSTKRDIGDAGDFLARVRGTPVHKYKRRDDGPGIFSTTQAEEENLGFIYDEVPEEARVWFTHEGVGAVSYNRMLAILWRAVQELSSKVPAAPGPITPPPPQPGKR